MLFLPQLSKFEPSNLIQNGLKLKRHTYRLGILKDVLSILHGKAKVRVRLGDPKGHKSIATANIAHRGTLRKIFPGEL